MSQFQPYDQNYGYISSSQEITRCTQDITTEVAVVGGGMAGLSAAQAFASKGKKVTLFEQYYCGSGATGKSSGFITPNTELSFSDIAKETNAQVAKNIWAFINTGVENIRKNITEYNFLCDLKNDPAFLVASCKKQQSSIIKEYEQLQNFGYQSTLFDKINLETKINTQRYFGGISYDNSFAINGYKYCQELKKLLLKNNVSIFEETPILTINNHTLTTPHAKITADYIIVCVDKHLPNFESLQNDVYHAQTFLLASEKVAPEIIKEIFPQNDYTVCDSELIYNYYRATTDNRILLGGGNLWSTYSENEKHNYKAIYKKLNHYFTTTFPQVKINFEYQWPGLIGISKDLLPIAGPDQKYPHIYYISAATGLSTAAALGVYSKEYLLEGRNDLDQYFNPYRTYFVNKILQKVLGKKMSFALNNFMVQKNLGCF